MSSNYPFPYTERPAYKQAISDANEEIKKIRNRVGVKNTVKDEMIAPIKERIVTLEAALRQCEPDPISTEDALKMLLEAAQHELDSVQRNVDKALKEINGDPLYGIACSGETLIKYSHKSRLLRTLVHIFSHGLENNVPFTEVVTEFNAHVSEVKKSLLSMRLASSTSVFHNMVDNLNYEVKAEMLDWSGGYSYFSHMIDRRLLDAVEVYNRINEVQ